MQSPTTSRLAAKCLRPIAFSVLTTGLRTPLSLRIRLGISPNGDTWIFYPPESIADFLHSAKSSGDARGRLQTSDRYSFPFGLPLFSAKPVRFMKLQKRKLFPVTDAPACKADLFK